EFRAALETFGSLYSSLASVGPSPDGGFSATVAQITWAPGQAQPAQPTQPTLPTPALPDPNNAAQTLSVGARADLERAVREELRRSLEDEVREELSAELRREEEQRLRGELEIQVRRQLLAELAPGLGESSVTVRDGSVHVQTSGPFIAVRPPKQVQVTSEQSPEALEVFRDEAQEHLQTITDGIKQLEQSPGDMSAVQAIRRAMHTLKGAAGMMGFTLIQRLAHTSEDLLDQLTDGAFAITPAMVGLTLDTAEALDQMVSGAIPDSVDQQRLVQALIVRYGAITGATDLPDFSAEEPESEGIAIALGAEDEDASAAPAASDGSDLSVRLQLSKLDELVNIFSELVQRRTIAEERITRLAQKVSETMGISGRVRELGAQIEGRFETVMLPSGAPGGLMNSPSVAPGGARGMPDTRGANRVNAGFDALEMDHYDEFHYLSRGLSEGVSDLVSLGREMERLIGELQFSATVENRLSSDFQDRLLRARLVPVRSLAPRLYRAARTSAQKEGKEIEFFIEGGDTEVDRKVIEAVEGPLLHLVRNAVNHGIERPEDRLAVGKPRAGKIIVAAAYEGNQVVISVHDDGAGIDPERIRTVAASRGQIEPTERFTEREAVNLIFQPGISTAA
ncbi:MAG TPA: Hpt domain-containing protein, partial [Ktedonobacterales bacterium]|nr:Hpt domain-containing protein [Ktedonobacterales bacterium]